MRKMPIEDDLAAAVEKISDLEYVIETLKGDLEVHRTHNSNHLALSKDECLALVEAYDNAYVSPESTVAFQTYRKIYNFATSK